MNPVDFARGLADAWNRRAIEEVLAHFDDRVLWAEERRELAIICTAEINGSSKKVSENLIFDPLGRMVRAEVFHDAPAITPA